MSLLDKLFKNKVENILDDIKQSESLLNDAEYKLLTLKESPKKVLLVEEIEHLVNSYGYSQYKFGLNRAHQIRPYDNNSDAGEIIHNIKQLLQELVK